MHRNAGAPVNKPIRRLRMLLIIRRARFILGSRTLNEPAAPRHEPPTTLCRHRIMLLCSGLAALSPAYQRDIIMAVSGKNGGQRTNNTSPSGQKTRTPTKTSHTGSRVEPSHVKDKSESKQATKTGAPAKPPTTMAKSAAKKR